MLMICLLSSKIVQAVNLVMRRKCSMKVAEQFVLEVTQMGSQDGLLLVNDGINQKKTGTLAPFKPSVARKTITIMMFIILEY